jgi:hypothetical protein
MDAVQHSHPQLPTQRSARLLCQGDCTRIRLVAAPLSFEKRDHIAIEFAVPRWMNNGKSKLKSLSQFRDEEAQLLQFR